MAAARKLLREVFFRASEELSVAVVMQFYGVWCLRIVAACFPSRLTNGIPMPSFCETAQKVSSLYTYTYSADMCECTKCDRPKKVLALEYLVLQAGKDIVLSSNASAVLWRSA